MYTVIFSVQHRCFATDHIMTFHSLNCKEDILHDVHLPDESKTMTSDKLELDFASDC